MNDVAPDVPWSWRWFFTVMWLAFIGGWAIARAAVAATRGVRH